MMATKAQAANVAEQPKTKLTNGYTKATKKRMHGELQGNAVQEISDDDSLLLDGHHSIFKFANDESTRKRRKRSQNTSPEQYEEYLAVMERDGHFRKAVINMAVGDSYVEETWNELCTRLNSVGTGPVLSLSDWKKRFNDWKNNTHSKYRKYLAQTYNPLGDHKQEITLTNIERRGLTVWDKMGAIVVPVTPQTELFVEMPPDGSSGSHYADSPQNMDEFVVPMEENSLTEYLVDQSFNEEEEEEEEEESSGEYEPNFDLKLDYSQHIEKASYELLQICKQHAKVDMEPLCKIIKEGIDGFLAVQQKKLEFEIAKYKHQHKDFRFE